MSVKCQTLFLIVYSAAENKFHWKLAAMTATHYHERCFFILDEAHAYKGERSTESTASDTGMGFL
jgi:hypothetical protein